LHDALPISRPDPRGGLVKGRPRPSASSLEGRDARGPTRCRPRGRRIPHRVTPSSSSISLDAGREQRGHRAAQRLQPVELDLLARPHPLHHATQPARVVLPHANDQRPVLPEILGWLHALAPVTDVMVRPSQRLYAEGHTRIVPRSVENGVNGRVGSDTGGGTKALAILR